MKKIQTILILTLAIFMVGFLTSCSKKDNLPNNGLPSIKYVRVTLPQSADSLLVGAFQGSLIAIVGQNLQNTKEIWFNDQKAVLTPTYITSTTILVTTPSPVPKVINNKIKIIFYNGDSLLYDFKILIKAPAIYNMSCEYVAAGDIATINGDYFYLPLTVTFAGGAMGEVVSIDAAAKILQVKVPAGALPGQITITTNFGVTPSNFWFRDNRNIFLSSDPYTGWWNASYVVSAPGAGDPPSINGNYIRVKTKVGSWGWMEAAGGPPDAMGAISKIIPDAAILKPSDYNLKFEVNTTKPYNNNMIIINVGLSSDFTTNGYKWAPPFDTHGVWQTVVIPFEEVVASYGAPLSLNANGYYTRVLFSGAGDLDCDMSFDNFRVVPKSIVK